MNKFLPVIGGHNLRLDEFKLMQDSYLEGFKALVLKLIPTGNGILDAFIVDETGTDVVFTSGYVSIGGEIFKVNSGTFPKSTNTADILYVKPIQTIISPSSPVIYENTTSNNVHFKREAILKYKVGTDTDGVNYSDLSYPGSVLEGSIMPWAVPAGKTVAEFFDATGKGINNARGYAICNGLNFTLDLRGMFLAETTNAFSTTPLRPILNGVTGDAGSEGGQNVVGLTQANLPNSPLSLSLNDPTHNHVTPVPRTFQVGAMYEGNTLRQASDRGLYKGDFSITNTSNAVPTGITISGTIGGNEDPHENRPPVYYLYYITRIS